MKNRIFQSKKNRMFSNWITQCFWSKNANYLDYLDLVKIRLAIMLSDFSEKKEAFLTINNMRFLK